MVVFVAGIVVALTLFFGFMLVLGLAFAYPWLLLVPLVILIGREFTRTFARIAHDRNLVQDKLGTNKERW